MARPDVLTPRPEVTGPRVSEGRVPGARNPYSGRITFEVGRPRVAQEPQQPAAERVVPAPRSAEPASSVPDAEAIKREKNRESARLANKAFGQAVKDAANAKAAETVTTPATQIEPDAATRDYRPVSSIIETPRTEQKPPRRLGRGKRFVLSAVTATLGFGGVVAGATEAAAAPAPARPAAATAGAFEAAAPAVQTVVHEAALANGPVLAAGPQKKVVTEEVVVQKNDNLTKRARDRVKTAFGKNIFKTNSKVAEDATTLDVAVTARMNADTNSNPNRYYAGQTLEQTTDPVEAQMLQFISRPDTATDPTQAAIERILARRNHPQTKQVIENTKDVQIVIDAARAKFTNPETVPLPKIGSAKPEFAHKKGKERSKAIADSIPVLKLEGNVPTSLYTTVKVDKKETPTRWDLGKKLVKEHTGKPEMAKSNAAVNMEMRLILDLEKTVTQSQNGESPVPKPDVTRLLAQAVRRLNVPLEDVEPRLQAIVLRVDQIAYHPVSPEKKAELMGDLKVRIDRYLTTQEMIKQFNKDINNKEISQEDLAHQLDLAMTFMDFFDGLNPNQKAEYETWLIQKDPNTNIIKISDPTYKKLVKGWKGDTGYENLHKSIQDVMKLKPDDDKDKVTQTITTALTNLKTAPPVQ